MGKWQRTPVFLPGKSHGRRSLVGYSPWVAKSWTRLSNFPFTFTYVWPRAHFRDSTVRDTGRDHADNMGGPWWSAANYLSAVLYQLSLENELFTVLCFLCSFHCGSYGKESACNAGNPGLIPGSGTYSDERNGNPLQYSCLENSMNGGDWRATVPGITKSWTRLSD